MPAGTTAVPRARRRLAHWRPQPAIPAVLVLLLTLLQALAAAGRPDAGLLVTVGVPAGLLVSAGLALAAGFCSFFPPLAWLAIAWLGAGLVLNGPVPLGGPALGLGTSVALAGLVLQTWRVGTGRFVPTVDPDRTDSPE